MQGITIFKTTPSGGEATYHAIVWSCNVGPGLSLEESDPRAEEVGELNNDPQEESDIRRHRAVCFRPEQPYLCFRPEQPYLCTLTESAGITSMVNCKKKTEEMR